MSNKIKRPMNAYMLFSKEKRSDFKTKYPNLKLQELEQNVKLEEARSKFEKEKYQALANADKERYLLAKTSKK